MEKSTGETYAIKRQFKNNPKIIKRSGNIEKKIMKEYIHMSKIDSIFVPKIKYTFKDDEAYYFVMKLLKSDIYAFTK